MLDKLKVDLGDQETCAECGTFQPGLYDKYHYHLYLFLALATLKLINCAGSTNDVSGQQFF